MKKQLLSVLTFCLLLAGAAHAQLPDLPIIRDTLYSKILKEARPLEIVLPAGYNRESAAGTSVIYATDGEWNTRIIAEFSQFLGIQFIPPQIIVGIDNTPKGEGNMRFRDLTPTAVPNYPGSGGGDLFLAFIKKELIPYINQKYPNKQTNTYFGASAGGLFGLYALLKEPRLFNSYLLADPSLFWDGYAMQKLAGENLEQLRGLNETVMLTGRRGQPFRGMGISAMDSVLRARAPGDLHLKTLAYDDETHNSMIFRTVYDGLKFIYKGYYSSRNFGLHPAYGYLEAGNPVTLYSPDTALADIRYTMDGTPPTRQSKRLDQASLEISAPAELHFVSFANKPEYDTTVSAHFQWSPQFKALSLPKNSRPGGLHYAIYNGISEQQTAKPVQSGTADSIFAMQKTMVAAPFTCLLDGYFEAKTDGYYLFIFDTPGEIQFSLAGRLLLNYPGQTGGSLLVPLKKGFYPFRLACFYRTGEKKLNLYYESPENVKTDRAGPLPLDLLYH